MIAVYPEAMNMIRDGTPFSLECSECQGCASGDGISSIVQAIAEGWMEIQPAPPHDPMSYFWGLCPEHVATQPTEAK